MNDKISNQNQFGRIAQVFENDSRTPSSMRVISFISLIVESGLAVLRGS